MLSQKNQALDIVTSLQVSKISPIFGYRKLLKGKKQTQCFYHHYPSTPHVPHKSLDQVNANFMPDAAQAVNRFPLSLSWRPARTPVLTPSLIFRHRISDSLTLISLILTWHGLLPCLFLNAHHKRLFTYAAWGGLKPAPVSRLRGAYPHLLGSYAHFILKVRSWRTCRYRRFTKMLCLENIYRLWNYWPPIWSQDLRITSSIKKRRRPDQDR